MGIELARSLHRDCSKISCAKVPTRAMKKCPWRVRPTRYCRVRVFTFQACARGLPCTARIESLIVRPLAFSSDSESWLSWSKFNFPQMPHIVLVTFRWVSHLNRAVYSLRSLQHSQPLLGGSLMSYFLESLVPTKNHARYRRRVITNIARGRLYSVQSACA